MQKQNEYKSSNHTIQEIIKRDVNETLYSVTKDFSHISPIHQLLRSVHHENYVSIRL